MRSHRSVRRYREAIERWVTALNTRGYAGSVERALAPDGEVLRFEAGAAAPANRFVGVPSVTEWLRRAPPATMFILAPAPLTVDEQAAPPVAEARYRVELAGWNNGGRWRFTLAGDGRIARLEHHPDQLPE